MAQSPDDMAATMIANLPAKTGKSLEQWLVLVGRCGAAKHGEIVKWLKSEHGMTHGFANLVAHKYLNSDAASQDSSPSLIDAQYAGAKANLRPIYERIVDAVRAFGNDIEVAPKKAYVSLRRKKQFALILPSTKTRVDVGIQLPETPAGERMEPSGSFNAMVSHRVKLGEPAEVDAELIGWLREAYQRAG